VLNIVVSQGQVQLLVRLTELIPHLTNQKNKLFFKYPWPNFRNIHQQIQCCGSGMFFPDLGGQKGTGSRIRTRNTV
jgi:hypothetical protein